MTHSDPLRVNTDELAYLHERIDQLIRQVSLEVGLEASHRHVHYGVDRARTTEIIDLARNRFRNADDAAAEKYGRDRRKI